MRATGLSLALCLGTLGVSAQALCAPTDAVPAHIPHLFCSDAPAHPGLKSSDPSAQHNDGDEPGDVTSTAHGHHDAGASDAASVQPSTGTHGSLRAHLSAHSAVLDTLGSVHDGGAGGNSDAQGLGLTVRPLTATERQSLGLDSGLLVTGVSAGVGLRAGFQPGDVVLSLDGVDITSPDQFYKLTQKLPHDRPVPVLVHRPNTTLFLPLAAPSRR